MQLDADANALVVADHRSNLSTLNSAVEVIDGTVGERERGMEVARLFAELLLVEDEGLDLGSEPVDLLLLLIIIIIFFFFFDDPTRKL
jgi:hypothetical protein